MMGELLYFFFLFYIGRASYVYDSEVIFKISLNIVLSQHETQKLSCSNLEDTFHRIKLQLIFIDSKKVLLQVHHNLLV